MKPEMKEEVGAYSLPEVEEDQNVQELQVQIIVQNQMMKMI
jgi:hypothetical protein